MTRRGWKTSTCPSSRNAAPRRRSRAKPGLEPLADAAAGRSDAPPENEAAAAFVDADNGRGRTRRRRSTARAQILMERFAEDAALVGALREYVLEHGAPSPRSWWRARRMRARSSPTISTTPNRSPRSRRTARWPCCAAATRRC